MKSLIILALAMSAMSAPMTLDGSEIAAYGGANRDTEAGAPWIEK